MKPEEYAVMYHAEEGHWWYRGMEHIILTLLNRWYAPGSNLRILDAGCGTGKAMTSYLTLYGEVTGFDFAWEAVRFSRQRGARRLIQGSVMKIPFPNDSFDLVVSLDVLCETGVPDDREALREIHRVLVPGGRILLRLPAYNWLRGHHDLAVHIRHRYNRKEVIQRLREASFQVEHLSYANMILFPLALIKRTVEKLWPVNDARSDLALHPGPLNDLFARILAAEALFIARWGLPFGLSLIAVGRKSPLSL
jgi:SAM-dependent methyltransferase